MKIIVPACAAFILLGCTLTIPVAAQQNDNPEPAEQRPPSKGEQELAKLLEGYSAGEPVSCLRRTQRDRLRVINDTALVFRDRGTIYVNRTNAPQLIDDYDIPVFKPFGSNLCRLDQVEFISRYGNIGGPVLILDHFVPYTKSDADS